jgi:hypothetical protein
LVRIFREQYQVVDEISDKDVKIQKTEGSFEKVRKRGRYVKEGKSGRLVKGRERENVRKRKKRK